AAPQSSSSTARPRSAKGESRVSFKPPKETNLSTTEDTGDTGVQTCTNLSTTEDTEDTGVQTCTNQSFCHRVPCVLRGGVFTFVATAASRARLPAAGTRVVHPHNCRR